MTALPAAIALAASASGWPPPVVRDHGGAVVVEAGGFAVHVTPGLLAEPDLCDSTLRTLRADLEMIEAAVPREAYGFLAERVPIWIEAQGATVPGGMSGRGMVFHPSGIWLKANGLDPMRAGAVEIVRAADYLAWRGHQPMMVLHELAHALHHLVGPVEPRIDAAFDAAMASGAYEAVAYGGDPDGETRRAYAAGNSREYFAEISEAYFGRNDFAPFDREALVSVDPGGAAVVREIWSAPEIPGGGPSR